METHRSGAAETRKAAAFRDWVGVGNGRQRTAVRIKTLVTDVQRAEARPGEVPSLALPLTGGARFRGTEREVESRPAEASFRETKDECLFLSFLVGRYF